MGDTFHPSLINGSWGDPGVILRWSHYGRRFLFDLPDLGGISPRELLKVSHVFVSHAHMDHFAGLDRLIRVMLGRGKVLKIFGPSPICHQVSRRLGSYSWNLVGGYEERLQIEVAQITGQRLETKKLDCKDGFRDSGLMEEIPFFGKLAEEGGFTVRCCVLDHGIPSVAYCLEEACNIQVLNTRLQEHGLRPGRWLKELKELLIQGQADDLLVEVEPSEMGPLPLGWLKENLLKIGPGQKFAYVVDAAPTEDNFRRIVSLVEGADFLFIEASFLQKDLERAKKKSHLTAFLAGQIGLVAGVKRLVPFHFSPKYLQDPTCIISEVSEAFGGRVVAGQFLVRE